MKKIISLLLSICMLMGMMSVQALAATKQIVVVNAISATVNSPIEGEMPKKTVKFTSSNKITVKSVEWFLGAKDGQMPYASDIEITDPFVAGKIVCLKLVFELPANTDSTEYRFKYPASMNEYSFYCDGQLYPLGDKVSERTMICEFSFRVQTKEKAAAQEAADAKTYEKYIDYTPFGRYVNVKVEPNYPSPQSVQDYVPCPEDFKKKARPSELPSVGYGILHGGSVPIYFSKSTTGYARGHMLNEIAAYGVNWGNYDNSRNPGTVFGAAFPYSNVACWYSSDTKFEVIEYDKDWVTVWSKGEWDTAQFSGCAYSNLSTNHKPGVYYIPAKNVYIIDGKNLVSKKPEIKAYGKTTTSLKIKTTSDSSYSQAGTAKNNQTVEICDLTPENGNYKIYYKGGVFYVNASYVNLKEKDVKKPTVTYTAVAVPQGKASEINVRSEASLDSEIVGKVKKGAALEVIEKNFDGKFTKIWFNSKECYITTEGLTKFKATASAAGQTIGTLAVDTASKAYGVATYPTVTFNDGEKSTVSGGLITLQQDTSAPVTEVKTHDYKYKAGSKILDATETWYKVIMDGEIRWARGSKSATYYPGESLKYNVTSNTQAIVVNSKKYEIVAYNINNNNYFKIRDIAQMISGSEKTVNVEWDEGANAINLVSMFDYESAGGELQKGDGSTRVATVSSASLNLDGVPTGAACYNINGNNYFKLRDVLDALDCRTEWDEKTQTINVSTILSK